MNIHHTRTRDLLFTALLLAPLATARGIDYPHVTAEPQKTGWPLTAEERAYVTEKPEHDRRPGRESNKHLPQLWPVVPSAGHFGGDSWLKLHEAHVKTVLANKGPIDVLLVGDSITMQWGESWKKHFPDLKAVNIGIGGDKTQNVLWRLDHGGVEGLQPQTIVLMIGNNNMFFTPETGIEAAAQGIEMCVKNLREKFPDASMIVAKILPAHAPGNRFYEDIRKTNAALDLLQLDSDPKVQLLDLTADFTHADGMLQKGLFTSDGIHLSSAGYAVYAAKLRPLLAPLAALHAAEPSAKAKPASHPQLAPIEDVAGLPRVLLIGDSVSIGYTLPTRELLKGKANVHRPPTNCSSTGNGLNHLKSWLGDKKWDVIHFNFGLHDAKLPPEGVRHAPPEVYEKNLRELVKQMKATGAKLIFATTTPVPNGGYLRPTRRFGSVDQYNAVALQVMKEMDVAIDDLNATIAPNVATMQRPNDVHFSDEGSALLAKSVAASIVTALGLPGQQSAAHAPIRRPNVIFILADDQGWGDARYLGHPDARTPNLDRLAADGTVISNFYVNGPVCSPSRVAFMTGQYPARLGFHHITSKPDVNQQRQVPDWLNPDVTTISDIVKQAGYTTAHFGKWHLGKFGDSPSPSAYGFDHAAVHSGPGEQLRNKKEVSNEDPFLMTQLCFDRAIAFMREQKDDPFYLNVWSSLPHAPLRPSPAQRGAYRDLSLDTKAFGKWMGDYIEAAQSPAEQMKTYLAAIAELDRQVGRLREALAELKLVENTIIVFSSDNGPEDYNIGNASHAGLGSPGSLRGRKRSLYEGGIRVPFIAAWPGKIPAGRVDSQTIMSGVDLMPTLAALTGIRCEAPAIDGEDLSKALLGEPAARRRPLHWEWFFEVVGNPAYFAPPLAVREGAWKFYCDYAGGNVQLFDIIRDPSELTDVSAQHPDVVNRLRTSALEWVKSLPPAPLRTAVANGADRMKLLDIRESRKQE